MASTLPSERLSEKDRVEEQQAEANNRKIRICLLIPKFGIGGAEVQVLDLIRHLDKSQFAVSLLCLTAGLDEMEQEARPYLETFARVGFRWRFFPISFTRMVTWLRRGRYDILHCHMPIADVIGRPAGWLARIPVILTTEHGRNVWKPWYYLLFERMLNVVTDMRICVSQDILEIRNRREGTPLSKLVRIPNAVETVKFRNPTRNRASVMAEFGWDPLDPLVVSVGRLEAEKNYPALVEAVGRARLSFPRMRCLLVGGGTRHDELLAMVSCLGLGEHIRLAGSRSDIPDLLGAADVFVLASLKEGLPVSLLEAMAAGKAVVVTSVGGMAEVISDGENGLVVPPGNVEELASAIGRLLGNKDLRMMFGKAVRDKAEREFGIQQVVEEIARVYTGLFARRKKHAENR